MGLTPKEGIMKKALVCFMFVLPAIALAQVTEEWVARYNGPANENDIARGIAVDTLGNVYVTGYSKDLENNWDYATVKYNSSGVEQWVARYDFGFAKAIAIDDAGNVYVTGVSHSDYTTVKYNSSGGEQWVACYDGLTCGPDDAYAIAIDNVGNVYVTGYSEGPGTDLDYATVMYNTSGVEQWVARYDGPSSGENIANAVVVDDAGNVYVTGGSYGSGTGKDYTTVKYNFSGIEQWVARYDGPASDEDKANAIAVDDAGKVYVTGSSIGLGALYDYATVKYSSSGVEEWAARYEGPVNDSDMALSIALDATGNVYVTGVSHSDYATVKYNSSGVEQWVVRYDGPASGRDEATAIAVDDAGNVYVKGRSYSSGARLDYATIKYNTSGVEQWVVRYDGSYYLDFANTIAIDDAGNVYITGPSADSETGFDYATIKYSQGPGVVEASPELSGHRLEVAQLTPEPVITYTLPVSTRISLKLYDVTGKLVKTLVTGGQEAGTHTVCWDAEGVSTGVYFVRLKTEGYSASAKMVVIN